ncbi:phytanoyl-CoA dioxygenase family protein [Lederbergia graminis]|uniref:Phytanoyl-CoA dioxygenase family protein n=1 Tax=Lederbergia graminis TaxID=735518 RepID=A0ABW0LJ71_9BACI|nr:phytanoyl-CoA dioxygenase family protein [Bacillaceae bacterium]
MKTFRTTEITTPLSAEQISQYERDGYLVVSQGCSKDLIHVYNSHIYNIRSAENVVDWAKPSPNKQLNDDGRFSLRLFNPHLHDSFSEQMMKLPIIRGALAQLLGDEAVGIQSMYFFKAPGTPGQAAHQDYYYIDNEPNTLTAAWIAMEDVDEENGCLWVIPGSHKDGLRPHGRVKDSSEHEAWTDETEGVDLSKQIPVVMKEGDIVFFHNLLIHSSGKNRSTDRWRKSYVCHYVRHDSEVVREDLNKKISLV